MGDVDLAGFEEFDRSAAPAPSTPFVTIQRKGLLSLNRGAYEALGRPAAVTLLYHREQRIVGLRPAEPTNPRAYPLRRQGGKAGGSQSYLVAATAFTLHHGIDTSVARRYGVEIRGTVLLIDLKQDAPDVTGPRAKERGRRGERRPAPAEVGLPMPGVVTDRSATPAIGRT